MTSEVVLHRPVPRWTISSARSAAYDRRNMAIDEAGHYVIGRHVGIRTGHAYIRPTGNDHSMDVKQWVGQYGYRSKDKMKLSQFG